MDLRISGRRIRGLQFKPDLRAQNISKKTTPLQRPTGVKRAPSLAANPYARPRWLYVVVELTEQERKANQKQRKCGQAQGKPRKPKEAQQNPRKPSKPSRFGADQPKSGFQIRTGPSAEERPWLWLWPSQCWTCWMPCWMSQLAGRARSRPPDGLDPKMSASSNRRPPFQILAGM